MSGLQLAHQIRSLRPDLPVILTSGYVNPEDQACANKLRIHAILTKPVNTKELLTTLRTLFAKRTRDDSPRASSRAAYAQATSSGLLASVPVIVATIGDDANAGVSTTGASSSLRIAGNFP
jgi:DNA-binding NtrC family response regulator